MVVQCLSNVIGKVDIFSSKDVFSSSQIVGLLHIGGYENEFCEKYIYKCPYLLLTKTLLNNPRLLQITHLHKNDA